MAGGNLFLKQAQKGSSQSSVFNHTEILQESSSTNKPTTPIFDGILHPGETIDFNQNKTPEKPKFDNYLQREQSLFIHPHKEEDAASIKKLKDDIKSLIPIAEDVNQDISNIPLSNIPEVNIYQISFFERVRNFLNKKASEASSWQESFNNRGNKKNAYWNNFKNKHGGTQSLNSKEHSVARSAN